LEPLFSRKDVWGNWGFKNFLLAEKLLFPHLSCNNFHKVLRGREENYNRVQQQKPEEALRPFSLT